jgi:UDP-2,3-diacylglucosamine pyrophosphatase LpxH
MHYRSIFISDTHLGAGSAQAKVLLNFLQHHTCDTLYLVGDIIDGWKVLRNKWKWKKSHTAVVNHILGLPNVVYISGNHDEFLRQLKGKLVLGGLQVHHKYEHIGVDGKRYLVTHGDAFDGVISVGKWLVMLGDSLYDLVLYLNGKLNALRHKMGFKYWSLSKYLKHRVKSAVSYIFAFEDALAQHCKRKNYHGVICGHIHHPEIKTIDDVVYMNCGDWVDNCSALVEHTTGEFNIIYWAKHETNTHSD